MTDTPANSVVDLLRAIRGDIADLKVDALEIKEPLGHMEALYANLSGRADRLSADMQQIKRRLDLVDA